MFGIGYRHEHCLESHKRFDRRRLRGFLLLLFWTGHSLGFRFRYDLCSHRRVFVGRDRSSAITSWPLSPKNPFVLSIRGGDGSFEPKPLKSILSARRKNSLKAMDASNGSNENVTGDSCYQGAVRTLYHIPPLPACEGYHTEERFDLDALEERLRVDGVVVVPKVFSQEQIEAFRIAHDCNFRKITKLLKETEAYEKAYRHDFDKKRYYVMPHYEIWDDHRERWEEVIEISPGRLDYIFGMNPEDNDDESEENSTIFGSVEFQRPKILAELMDRMLQADYESYAGALPSAGSSKDGPWHRDVYLLFDDESVDVNLPHPYYFTVLIPLVKVDAENGATQFLLGSHKQICEQALNEQKSYQPTISPGDMIVFDGRICHRGRENKTNSDRTVLYMVWTKKWYNDY